MNQEHAKLEDLLAQSFGYYLLWLTDTEYKIVECPISTSIHVLPDTRQGASYNTLVGEWQSLPFAADSIDAIALAHVSDWYEDMQGVLKETHRVLRHDGKLFITGFNPARIKARRLAKQFHQHAVRLRLCSTMLNELTVAGYEIEKVRHFGFFAIKNRLFAKWVNRMLSRLFPGLGCGYVIVAYKKVLTPIADSPNWTTPILKPEKVIVPSCRVDKNL
jgi:SAM-dependent methyltransferase